HVEDLMEGGKHPHEAGLTMLIPYLLLAVGSLGLGLAYPLYSGPLTTYIAGTFSTTLYTFPAGISSASGLTDLLLLSVSTVVAVVGGAIAYLTYFRKDYVFKTGMNPIQRFLYKRWYLDAIYYRVFVTGLLAASRGLYRYVEQGIWNRLNNTIGRDIMDYSRASDQLDTQVVDRAANEVASYGSRLSNLLRKLQSGVSETYVIAFAIGIILLLTYMLFVVGATYMIGLLSIAIFLPTVLAAPTFLLGRKNPKMAKILGVGTTAIVFAISILILIVFQYGQAGFQLSESLPWAGSFGLNYKVGIDGISLPLLMIATFLSLLSAAGSWDQITFRHAEYYALFLIFETGIIGVFTSLNLILFYLFWEIVLIPMFFFIGIWGGPRRKYASLKFLIFTYSGSAVMLFGFLALYAWTGTSAYPGGPSFDYDVLAARIPTLALPLQLAVAITTFVGFAVK